MKRAGLLLGLMVLSGCHAKTIDQDWPCIGTRHHSDRAFIKPGSQEDLEHNVGHYVLFTYNSAVLQEDALATLERQAAFFKHHSDAKIVIEGHADERGTREYNIGLGERRATAVQDYLLTNGVDTSRLRIVSYGKERPAVLGDTEEAWSQNRRAVTVIEE